MLISLLLSHLANRFNIELFRSPVQPTPETRLRKAVAIDYATRISVWLFFPIAAAILKLCVAIFVPAVGDLVDYFDIPMDYEIALEFLAALCALSLVFDCTYIVCSLLSACIETLHRRIWTGVQVAMHAEVQVHAQTRNIIVPVKISKIIVYPPDCLRTVSMIAGRALTKPIIWVYATITALICLVSVRWFFEFLLPLTEIQRLREDDWVSSMILCAYSLAIWFVLNVAHLIVFVCALKYRSTRADLILLRAAYFNGAILPAFDANVQALAG